MESHGRESEGCLAALLCWMNRFYGFDRREDQNTHTKDQRWDKFLCGRRYLPASGGARGLRHGPQLDQTDSQASDRASEQSQQDQGGHALKQRIFLFRFICHSLVSPQFRPRGICCRSHFSIRASIPGPGKGPQAIAAE